MIDLASQQPFAQGGNRLCFIHPEKPNRCLKVLLPNRAAELKAKAPWYKRWRSSESFDDNARELQGYGQRALLHAKEDVWQHLARCYGEVKTNLGLAVETDLILLNGGIAPTLDAYLREKGLTVEIKKAIKDLESWLLKYQVLTKNILPHNLVIKESNGQKKLVIIDGLGSSAYIPLPSISRFFADKYIRRRIAKMHVRIQWEADGRKVEWEEAEKA